MKVLFTVDVEIWPGQWTDIDARFPQAFRRYVYGDTPFGQYGLPLTVQVLRDNGLVGVFFVEPMFSARFGLQPLQEVVGLIADAGQEVQLHLHAEWVDEARLPLLAEPPRTKVQHLSHFGREDQTTLVAWARARLAEAGAAPISAFRAGSFAANRDTLSALEANGIGTDSSYNHCFRELTAGIGDPRRPTAIPVQPYLVGNVLEYPVTVYRDYPGHLRPLQLTACSLREMIAVLERSADEGHSTAVIVSHNFEMMDRRDFSRDEIVAQRFYGLCEFLGRNRHRFDTTGFAGTTGIPAPAQPAPVAGSLVGLATRYQEQIQRRVAASR